MPKACAKPRVIGVPDGEWGERLHAFVVTERGRTLDADALQRLCRDRLAGYKVPKAITFIGELPRNAGGKVLKNELRAIVPVSSHT
jgi:acyl-CoA synthetase (AMP-forming)/AMP-acid ligase II